MCQNAFATRHFSWAQTIKIAFAAGVPPRTSPGSLQRSPKPLAGFHGRERGKCREERDREEEEGRKGRISGTGRERAGESKETGKGRERELRERGDYPHNLLFCFCCYHAYGE